MSSFEHGLESHNEILNKDERQSTANMHKQMAFSDEKKELVKTMSCIHMNLGSPAGVGYDRWIDYQNNTSSQVT
jgi:hypothetical protein